MLIELRQAIKILSENGWHILAGTKNNRYCCAPEDMDFKDPMTIEDALNILKKK